jgi:exopolyphosphatase / guanosine-5'-triphosphate,3'-diphosphate pyrophosphatase
MATLLFRKPRIEAGVASRTAIIDIGSNSIRLVVYQGPDRLPAILFNEKVMAGLGRSLSASGAIDPAAMEIARTALARFVAVTRAMEVGNVRTVATAAVRDASNGNELLRVAQRLGLDVELLSGEDEALAAGHGVLSGIPEAHGIVADLGGGSLELVQVRNGKLGERASFPLGVLRVAAIRAKGRAALERKVARLIAEAGWKGRGKGVPLYLVGGSWRAVARLDMHLNGYPLPIIHEYAMSREQIIRAGRTISHVARGKLRSVPGMSSARVPMLGDATALLVILMKQLGIERTVASAFGLREGLLYGALDEDVRRQDPLIVAARDEGARLGRFAEHGDLLDRWVAPLFVGEAANLARLRHAACLLADVGWHANPEFRAERGLEIALHGNWVGIDGWGRAMLGQALFTALAGGAATPEPLQQLATPADLALAMRWGLAIRLGQRLSAGLAEPLRQSRLSDDGSTLTLHLEDPALYGETVEKRHTALASAFGRVPIVTI